MRNSCQQAFHVRYQMLQPDPYLASLGCLVLGRLVVPVLEVLVDCGLLCITTLGEHGAHASSSDSRVAMHGLAKGSIALLVLPLELNLLGGVGHVE